MPKYKITIEAEISDDHYSDYQSVKQLVEIVFGDIEGVDLEEFYINEIE